MLGLTYFLKVQSSLRLSELMLELVGMGMETKFIGEGTAGKFGVGQRQLTDSKTRPKLNCLLSSFETLDMNFISQGLTLIGC